MLCSVHRENEAAWALTNGWDWDGKSSHYHTFSPSHTSLPSSYLLLTFPPSHPFTGSPSKPSHPFSCTPRHPFPVVLSFNRKMHLVVPYISLRQTQANEVWLTYRVTKNASPLAYLQSIQSFPAWCFYIKGTCSCWRSWPEKSKLGDLGWIQ